MLAAYLYIQLCLRATQKQNQKCVGQGAKILTRMLTSLETSAFARDAWAFDFKEENMPLVSFCVRRLFRIRDKGKDIKKDKKPSFTQILKTQYLNLVKPSKNYSKSYSIAQNISSNDCHYY